MRLGGSCSIRGMDRRGMARLCPMPRLSEYLLPTEKQAPADAEAISHKLMVRAGLVRQLGAGMWTWLPAGWRVHQRVVQIIREEMDAIGGQEMLDRKSVVEGKSV